MRMFVLYGSNEMSERGHINLNSEKCIIHLYRNRLAALVIYFRLYDQGRLLPIIARRSYYALVPDVLVNEEKKTTKPGNLTFQLKNVNNNIYYFIKNQGESNSHGQVCKDRDV